MMTPTLPRHQSESPLTPPPRVEEPLPTVSGIGDDDQRRRAHLGDPEILGSVRDVLRLRGVALDLVNDKLSEVVEDALLKLAKVPVEREEARLYLCGMARYKAIDDANDRKRELEHRAKVSPKDADTRSPSLDDVLHARGLVAKGKRRFPRAIEWLLRHELGGESHRQIGASANLSAQTVRKTIKSLTESLAAADRRKISMVVVAALLAVVFGMDRWRHISSVSWDDQLSKTHDPRADVPHVHHLPVDDDAAALRARAKQECALGQWDLCANDLKRAEWFDPAPQPLDIVQLEGLANEKLNTASAKPNR